MGLSIQIKIFNKSLLVFLLVAVFSWGFLALADEQETITTFLNDADQDGLTTDEEKAYGTDPTNNDTDGDGYSDGVEVQSGYDPLKPAPGDRIVPDETASGQAGQAGTAQNQDGSVNLTELAKEELNGLVSEKQDANQEITSEDLNQAVANVLEQSNQEVDLSEVDESSIKIKEVSKKLSDEEKEAKKKEDTLEYLTTMMYIFLSNSPTTIRSATDIESFILRSGQELVFGLTSGSFKLFDDFEQRGKRILIEIDDVKVPENMISTHVRAIKIAKFLIAMSQKIRTIDPLTDPLGQISELSKLQGILYEMQSFITDSRGMLTKLGINSVPLNL